MSYMAVIPCWFVFLRFFVLLGLMWITGLSIYVGSKEHHLHWFHIELVHWTQTLCLLTAMVRFATTIAVKKRSNKLNNSAPSRLTLDFRGLSRSWKCVHTLQSKMQRIALPMVTMMVIDGWMIRQIIFPMDGDIWEQLNVMGLYCLSAVLMWVDYLLSAERIYYRSVLSPIFVLTLYTFWNATFVYVHDGYVEEDDSSTLTPKFSNYCVRVLLLLTFSFLATCTKNAILRKMEDMGLDTPSRVIVQQSDDDYLTRSTEEEEQEQMQLV